MPRIRTKVTWKATNLAKLGDCYEDLGIHERDPVCERITATVDEWEFSRSEAIPTDDDYEGFLENNILADPAVRAINQRRLEEIREGLFKNKQPFDPVKFDKWLGDVWDFFVKQKLKNAKRKFLGRRLKSDVQRTPTPSPATPSRRRQSSFISPPSPLLSNRSRSSFETPNSNATLLNPINLRSSSPEFEDQMIDMDPRWTVVGATGGSNEVQPFTPRPFSIGNPFSNSPRLQSLPPPPKNTHRLTRADDGVFETPSPPAQKRVKGTSSHSTRTSVSLPASSASAASALLQSTIALWIDSGMISTADVRMIIDAKDSNKQDVEESGEAMNSTDNMDICNTSTEPMDPQGEPIIADESTIPMESSNAQGESIILDKSSNPISENPPITSNSPIISGEGGTGSTTMILDETSENNMSSIRDETLITSSYSPVLIDQSVSPSNQHSTSGAIPPTQSEISRSHGDLQSTTSVQLDTARVKQEHDENDSGFILFQDEDLSLNGNSQEDENVDSEDDGFDSDCFIIDRPGTRLHGEDLKYDSRERDEGSKGMSERNEGKREATIPDRSSTFVELSSEIKPAGSDYAPPTPEPESDNEDTKTLLGGDKKAALRVKLRLAQMQGNMYEHKELRSEWKPEYLPPLRAPYELRPWQKNGVTFLHHCQEQKIALLGDEMGIGKTLQVYSFLWGRIQAALNGVRNPASVRHFCAIVVPPVLQSNWLRECRKFFDSKDLRAKAFTEVEWRNDRDMRTIWIIRDSLLSGNKRNTIVNCLNARNVENLATIADESHLGCRSPAANRAETWRLIAEHANFVCQISGTLFPLGPKKDAKGILTSLGGLFNDQRKWTAAQRVVLDRLFGQQGKWDILAFRGFITPFYLCRTEDSTWDGQYIVPRVYKRPIARIENPEDLDYEATLTAHFNKVQTQTNRDGLADLGQFKFRADEIRKLAWTPIWTKVRSAMPQGTPNQKMMEAVIEEHYPKTKVTGRLRKMIQDLRRAKAEGRRFIICSASTFLITVAVYICEKVLNFKVGVLSGSQIFGHKSDAKTRSKAIADLNNKQIDGIVMNERVGSCGHNMPGASVMMFMGSLYSQAVELQCIGRMCRPGQEVVPEAIIYANPQFVGDSVALEVKRLRGEGESDLRRRLTKGEYDAHLA